MLERVLPLEVLKAQGRVLAPALVLEVLRVRERALPLEVLKAQGRVFEDYAEHPHFAPRLMELEAAEAADF